MGKCIDPLPDGVVVVPFVCISLHNGAGEVEGVEDTWVQSLNPETDGGGI